MRGRRVAPWMRGRGRACGCAPPMLHPLSETSASRPTSRSPIAVGVSVSDCVCLVLGVRVYARACTSMHAYAHLQQRLHVRMRRALSAREGMPRPAIPGEPLREDEPSTRTHTNHRLCPLHSRGHQVLPRVSAFLRVGKGRRSGHGPWREPQGTWPGAQGLHPGPKATSRAADSRRSPLPCPGLQSLANL